MSNLKNILLSKDIAIPSDFDVFKNIYRHFKGKNIKVDDQPLAGDSRPLLDKAEDFYLHSPGIGFLQGDILKNVPAT